MNSAGMLLIVASLGLIGQEPKKSPTEHERIGKVRSDLKSDRVEIRRAAILSLVHSDLSPKLREEIQGALGDKDAEVRAVAATATGNLGAAAVSAVPTLISLLDSDPSKEARETAARALGRIGKAAKDERRAVPALRKCAGNDADPVTRVVALGALAMMDVDVPAQIAGMRKFLHDDTPLVRMKAAHGLGMIGLPAKAAASEIVTVLEQAADVHHRGYIARALGNVGDPASLPALYKAIAMETDPGTRGEMQGAISRLGGEMPSQRLVLASASYGKNIIAICDADGKVLWSHHTAGPKTGHAGHHDLQFLDNGNILFHDNWTTIVEMTLDRKIVWTYDSSTMNGNKGKHAEVHAFRRLPNGLTMIAESGVGRIIEVDKDGKIHAEIKLKPGGTQHTRMARKLDNGNYLVCAENPGVVTEYNAKSEVVWEYPIKTRVYGAIRLRNGNTLIASGSGSSVVEVTREGKVVWEIKDNLPGTKTALKWTTFLTELENGNFVVGNCHAGDSSPQIFEITRDRKVVWQFNQFETFGNGLACSQVLNDQQAALVRKLLAKK
jgi:HEAT repeat protein